MKPLPALETFCYSLPLGFYAQLESVDSLASCTGSLWSAGVSLYNDSHLVDDEPYRRLWSAVVLTAIQDVEKKGLEGERARRFLLSESEEPTSIHWICRILDLDPTAVRMRCLSKAGRLELLSMLKRPVNDDQSSLDASSDAFG
jgi:hypothetical protein